ncbi:DUF6098 family protein [Streptomyces glomeratus]|jgi:hypothetical protein|uniref:Uncharacterized protein n=1 Tax=Streptomyces glomeratus TaxID=284452 RepID=A0ABP6LY22_9ACTN|nr:DUF6098 family protein [Streptomyces glomeratus]MCF1510168.1 DUF6098 family protein [Streptomyces glomeratus]
MTDTDELPVLRTLGELGALVERHSDLYVRWSHGPHADLRAAGSRDDLTGVRMPGLSANPLGVEPWWGDRPVELWVARRLHDYSHLPREKGEGVRPWVLRGRVEGRGPDNEPLVADVEPVGWVDDTVIRQAQTEVDRQVGSWGPLRRDDDR